LHKSWAFAHTTTFHQPKCSITMILHPQHVCASRQLFSRHFTPVWWLRLGAPVSPTGFKTPIQAIYYKSYFFCSILNFAPSSPRHHFFASTLSFSFFHDDKHTNERTNVTLPFSHHVHLLLSITNILPFALFLFLLTLERLQRWRRRWRWRRC
jgi:hypothetical protein